MDKVPSKQANQLARQLMAIFYQLQLPSCILSEALHGKEDFIQGRVAGFLKPIQS